MLHVVVALQKFVDLSLARLTLPAILVLKKAMFVSYVLWLPVCAVIFGTFDTMHGEEEQNLVSATCPDKLLNDTGLGSGGTVTALANVSTLSDCCALCHGQYHDECVGWVFGHSEETLLETLIGPLSYPSHNCAVMATNGPPRTVEHHTAAIITSTPPSPAPQMHGGPCQADLDCLPGTYCVCICSSYC